ncbi:TIGR01212 family radical SAM protein [Desulfonatronum sp. SC1]|uniref:TIGR01212 family radical SAM protein n=1 Tax=Desulfonatronum sp. SC1 TaxID=2109626 RepID=UPI002101082C|nr:TIGR01212 family radical SAM protein [Desulfonatronum sp. SC1]
MSPFRFNSLSVYLRSKYGVRVRKIPLDAGSTCPNRDGLLSRSGCVFCNPSGSGTGLFDSGLSLSEQWIFLTRRLGRKYKTDAFWAYLQSFSNTYGPLSRVRRLMGELAGLPGVRLIGLGTRPDCLDEEKLRCIADCGFAEVWLDIGLQSANDRTLQRINRGHDFACFARCVDRAHARGLFVCAHIMHGLPGESDADFLETINQVNRLPVTGIKFHNLFVAKGSPLEPIWRSGGYVPPTKDAYVRAVIAGLELLRSDIIVHRLNADPLPDELLAPRWARDKRDVLDTLRRRMEAEDARQGRNFPYS